MMYEVPCGICGASDRRILFDRARNNERVTNVICLRCGLVYISPREDGDTIRNHYVSGAYSLQARGSNPSTKKFSESEAMAMGRFRRLHNAIDLGAISLARFLEIGCGVGSFLRLMKGAGWENLGLEPDSNYAQAGKDEYGVNIQTQIYCEFSCPEQFFDIVASFHVIEHIASPRVFLKKIARELKVGGLLYLESPCIEHPYGGDLENFFWSVHLYTFSKHTLMGLLKQVGFQIIRASYDGDFLWILASKAHSFPVDPPCYPFDSPDEVWRHTRKLYKKFLFQKAVSKMPKACQRVVNLPLRAVRKLRHAPSDFFPVVGRRIKIGEAKARRFPIVRHAAVRPRNYVTHFGLHSPGNAGDTLLFEAVRKLMDKVNGPYHWALEPLWSEVAAQTINRINRESRSIIVGGGGILLRDTNPNHNSGWQWNISIEHLRQIEVPIVVFAIGYNRFSGQEEFDQIFREHIQTMVRSSVFFGLRNHGSIRALAKYLDGTLSSKLRFQPCPTTLLRYIYPEYHSTCFEKGTRRLALNVAFDRHRLRFGQREDEILTSIAHAMKWANEAGWEINLVVHCCDDDTIIPWLIREGVVFCEIRLDGRPAKEILNFYHQIPLTIGMRGHSQMIPFGMGNAIISLVSHEKLSYFLEDIGHPEWGIDVRNRNLRNHLIEMIEFVDLKRNMIRGQIFQAQEMLKNITNQNFAIIKETL